jgi:hypothetical protein
MALYNCRETFTDVMSALQIGPICSNKPNFRKSQMNVTKVITSDYEEMDTWSIRKNKPNSNPIQTQFKANQTQNKPNTKPKQTQFHTNFALLKLVSTSRITKSFLNFFAPPRVIVGKTALIIRKDALGISRGKIGNRVCFRN